MDWEGENYCGYKLEWNYEKGYIDVSMPTYIPKMLAKYNHKAPDRLQKAPHQWSTPVYGQKRQYAKSLPDLPTLPKHLITEIQQKTGSILYYARAMGYTMLPSLSDISTTQAKPHEKYSQGSRLVIRLLRNLSLDKNAISCFQHDFACSFRCSLLHCSGCKKQNRKLLLSP